MVFSIECEDSDFCNLHGNYQHALPLNLYLSAIKHHMRKLYVSLLLIVLVFTANAQVSVKDSAIAAPLLGFSFGYHQPGGDLYDRFGPHTDIGFSFLYKTKKNLLIGIHGSYLFSNNVKETGILDSLRDSNGFIINQNGQYAEVRLFERGWNIHAGIGKLFDVWGPNPNSGFFVYAGAGYLQHKIKIDDIGNQSPQLAGDYRKGYDRLTSGLAFTEMAGYIFLSNKRLVNFFAAIELTQGFTQSRRSWDFDLMRRDTQKRIDLAYGVRAGWILPLYKKVPNEYYYY